MSHEALARDCLDRLTAAGFDKARCAVTDSETHEISAEAGALNLLRTNFDTEIQLLGIADHRRASISINGADDAAIDAGIQDLLNLVRGSEPDEAYDIAPEQAAESFSCGTSEPDYDGMYDRIEEILEYSRDTYPVINMRSAGATFNRSQTRFLNSNGVDFKSDMSRYDIGIGFASKEGAATSSMMYTGYAAFDLNEQIKDCAYIDELLQQSTEQIKTKPVPAKFQGEMIITPHCLGSFIGFLLGKIVDYDLISGTSVYKDKLDQQVASEKLSIHSHPVSASTVGGYFVTGDGFKAEDVTILDAGVLKSFQLSLYGANKTGLARAANSGGCYFVDPGDTPLNEIIKGTEQGVLIGRFSGGRPNDRGDFSGVAKNSYYVEDGKIQYPISETMVSGNLVDLIKNVEAVSSELIHFGGSASPWVKVSGITVS